jgi:hypothetical protein
LFLFAVNWEDIKTEIICSNVIQKNNILFARKLDKALIKVAKEGDKNVCLVALWRGSNSFLVQGQELR